MSSSFVSSIIGFRSSFDRSAPIDSFVFLSFDSSICFTNFSWSSVVRENSGLYSSYHSLSLFTNVLETRLISSMLFIVCVAKLSNFTDSFIFFFVSARFFS